MDSIICLVKGIETVVLEDIDDVFDSFKDKFEESDAAHVSVHILNIHTKKLDNMATYFINQSAPTFKLNSEFIHFYALAQHQCVLIKLFHSKVAITSRLSIIEKEVIAQTDIKDTCEASLSDLDMLYPFD